MAKVAVRGYWTVAGYSLDFGKTQEWKAEKLNYTPRTHYDLRDLVIETSDGVYVSREVELLAGDDKGCSMVSSQVGCKRLVWGGKKFDQLTRNAVAVLTHQNAYPPRSERERQVRTRRQEVVNWLAELAGFGKVEAEAYPDSQRETTVVVSDFVAETMKRYGF